MMDSALDYVVEQQGIVPVNLVQGVLLDFGDQPGVGECPRMDDEVHGRQWVVASVDQAMVQIGALEQRLERAIEAVVLREPGNLAVEQSLVLGLFHHPQKQGEAGHALLARRLDIHILAQAAAVRHDHLHPDLERPAQEQGVAVLLRPCDIDGLLLADVGEEHHVKLPHESVVGIDSLIRRIDAHGTWQPLDQTDAPLGPLPQRLQRIVAIGMHGDHWNERRRILACQPIDVIVRDMELGSLEVNRAVRTIMLIEGHQRVSPALGRMPDEILKPLDVFGVRTGLDADARRAHVHGGSEVVHRMPPGSHARIHESARASRSKSKNVYVKVHQAGRIHISERLGDQRLGIGTNGSRQLLWTAREIAAQLVVQRGAGTHKCEADDQQEEERSARRLAPPEFQCRRRKYARSVASLTGALWQYLPQP